MKEILKKNTKIIVVVSFLLILCNILNSLHPFVMKKILDINLEDNNIQNILTKLVIVYVAIHIFYILSKTVRNSVVNKAMAKILKELREKLFCKVLKWDMLTYEKYNSSEIYTRLTADVDNVSTLFLGILQVVLNNLVYILIMVTFMFIADIRLAIIGTIGIIIIASISYIFTKKLAKLNRNLLDKRDQENTQYSELYNKSKLTYLFGLQKNNIKNCYRKLDEELQYRKSYVFTESFIYPLAVTIQAITIYAILYNALNINIGVSLGSIYLIINYIKECRGPLNEMLFQIEEMQSSFMSLKRINNLLKEHSYEDIEKGEKVENLKGDIEFVNVSMQYGENKVLKNISFHINEGSKVTIAGRTGVGKTTLANVLMRLYPITEGQILIGERDISKVRIKDIRNNISYISQTPYILDDTLKNNIILGDKTITDEEIEKVAKEIGFESVLHKFKDGLYAKIERTQLSYGQLQMVAFLRAILHKSDIYIFDEPTSNIDLKTEDRIQNLINKITKESTVIIIAHRKSTIENSDKIIYLKDGKVDLIKNYK